MCSTSIILEFYLQKDLMLLSHPSRLIFTYNIVHINYVILMIGSFLLSVSNSTVAIVSLLSLIIVKSVIHFEVKHLSIIIFTTSDLHIFLFLHNL